MDLNFELDDNDGLLDSQVGLPDIHAILMAIGFLILMPVAILASVFRSQMKCIDGKVKGAWFRIFHFPLMLIAAAMTLASLGVIVVYKDMLQTHFDSRHGKLGLALIIAAIVQCLIAVFLRAGKKRKFWIVQHILFAYFILFGGLVNCWLGIMDDSDYLDPDKLTISSRLVHFGTGMVVATAIAVTLRKGIQGHKYLKEDK